MHLSGTSYTLNGVYPERQRRDGENRLTGVSGGKTATFVYDGDGKLVKTQVGTTYVAIAGPHYQYSGATETKHYYAGDVRVAKRVGRVLYWPSPTILGHATSSRSSGTSLGSAA